MNETDIRQLFGEPDAILQPSEGMRSSAWRCVNCEFVRSFDQPVRPPKPCSRCGGIAFQTVPQ